MPVIFNEPLSFLQRMTEYMEYARLIRIASEQEDPIERMKYIAGMLRSIKAFIRIKITIVYRFCRIRIGIELGASG